MLKRAEEEAARTIKVGAEQAGTELNAAKNERAKAVEVLATADAKLADLQARIDAADQRGAENERTRAVLKGKAEKLAMVLAAFIADL